MFSNRRVKIFLIVYKGFLDINLHGEFDKFLDDNEMMYFPGLFNMMSNCLKQIKQFSILTVLQLGNRIK